MYITLIVAIDGSLCVPIRPILDLWSPYWQTYDPMSGDIVQHAVGDQNSVSDELYEHLEDGDMILDG